MQAADATGSALDELLEQDDTIEYSSVLNYVQGAMTNSSLLNYIDPSAVKSPKADSANDDDVVFETYKGLLRSDGLVDQMPKMSDFTTRLVVQCNKMFGEVAETLRKNILHRCTLSLPGGLYVRDKMAVRMQIKDDGAIEVFLATVHGSDATTCMCHPLLELETAGFI